MILACRAALALSVLVFIPGLLEQFEPAKAAAVRICGAAALGLALTGWARRLPRAPLDLAVLAWLAAELLATAFSTVPWISFFGEQEQREGLLTSLGLAGVYLAARAHGRDGAAIARTLDVAVLAAAGCCLYALAQAAGLDPLPWTRRATVGGSFRPFGTLGHPNLMAAVAAALLPAAALRAAAEPGGRGVRWTAAALLGLGTLFSFSRAGWLAAVAGCVVAGGLALAGGLLPRPSRRVLLAGGVAAGALVALVVLSGWGGAFATRFAELVSPQSGSARARVEIWRGALDAWRARPVLGWGPDAFAMAYSRYQSPEHWRLEWGGTPGHAHSIYLHALATRGAAGFAAGAFWAAALLLAVRAACRGADRERRTLVAALAGAIAGLGVAGAFGALGAAGAALLVAASGMLAGMVWPTSPPRKRGWLWAALVILALAWSGVEVAASRATARARAGVMAGLSGPPAAREAAYYSTLRAAERAAALLPYDDWGPRYAAEAELAMAGGGAAMRDAISLSIAYAREAVRRVPARAVNHLRLGSALGGLAALGQRRALEESEAAFRRAAELAPASPVVLYEWARVRLRTGRAGEALELAERGARLYPDDALSLSMIAAARLMLGEREAALAALRRAAEADWHGDEAQREATRRLVSEIEARPSP